MSSPSRLEVALQDVPDPVREALEQEFAELSQRFLRQDWGPARLHGGRFAEGVFRYLEWKQTGKSPAVSSQLRRQQIVQAVEQDTSLDPGLRFHVRRCAELLMDVRNKRDVAHLGEKLNVNEMDSQLVLRLAAWTLSEIIRVENQMPAEEIQRLIDRFSVTHHPLVEDIDGDLVLLEKGYSAAERVLIVLFHTYPEPLTLTELRAVVGYSNSTLFRDNVIGGEVEQGRLHLRGDRVHLTRKGVMWVEAHVDRTLSLDS